MNIVTKYRVYDGDTLMVSYDSQAPATSWAKSVSRRGGLEFEVVEETFALMDSRVVRRVSNGKVDKCS